MSRTPTIVLAFLIFTDAASAMPDSTAGSTRASLNVTTSPDSGYIYVDGLFVCRAPARIDSVVPGRHILHIAHPDYANWLTEGVTDTIAVETGEALTRHYTLSHWYSIISVPSGAGVYVGDSLLGLTPLILHPNSVPTDSSLTARKAGYTPVTSSLALAVRGVLILPLVPSGGKTEENDWRFDSSPRSKKNTLPLWIAGGSAVVFGGFSAYYKLAADDQQQAFLATGNPYNAAERSRLDNLSALYFVAAQIGLGAFIAYMLSD
jgi:PEGA domain